MQERLVDLWEEGHAPRKVSIADLARYVNFEHLQKLSFKNPMLRRHLLDRGLEQFKAGSILPTHLEMGQKWKTKIEEGVIPKVSLRWINSTAGFGLFAEEDLEEGTFVGEYVGEVRENNDHLRLSDYLYAYPLLDELGRNFVIDAQKGSLTRFINHSYHPNLFPTYAYVDGLYHMILITDRPIHRGTQLSYNYGRKYWAIRQSPEEL